MSPFWAQELVEGIEKNRTNLIRKSWQGVSRLTRFSRKLNSLSNVYTIASRNPPIESERGGRVRTRWTKRDDELYE